MQKNIRTGMLWAAVASAPVVASVASADVISFKPFGSSSSTATNNPVGITQGSAGAPSVSEPYSAWMSSSVGTNATAVAVTSFALTDNAGAPTGVSLTLGTNATSHDSFYADNVAFTSFNASSGDYQLFDGAFNTNPTSGPVTFALSGMNAFMSNNSATGYDVYVYFSGNVTNSTYSISDQSGTTYWNYGEYTGATYVQATATTSGADTVSANYAIFYETTNSPTFTVSQASSGANIIYGIQIIPVPEPVSLGVIGALSTIGLLRRRDARRR